MTPRSDAGVDHITHLVDTERVPLGLSAVEVEDSSGVSAFGQLILPDLGYELPTDNDLILATLRAHGVSGTSTGLKSKLNGDSFSYAPARILRAA